MTELYSVRRRALLLAVMTLILGVSTLSAQWSTLPDLPQQRSDAMSAVLNNRLYVFGGLTPQGSVGSEAWYLDLDNPDAGWTQITGLPENRAGGFAAAYNGKIYIMAGVGVDAAVVMRTNVLEYDPAMNAYSSKSAMQYGSWFNAGTVLGTKAYIIGGLARVGTSNTPTATAMVYDMATDTWSQGTNLPSAIYDGQAATINGDVYFFGGQPSSTQISTVVLKMTGGTGTWAQAGTMTTPVFGAAVGVINNKAYVAGGNGTGGLVASTQIFDGSTWTPYFSMPITNKDAAAAVSGSEMFAVSGQAGRQALKMELVAPKPVAAVTPLALDFGVAVGSTKQKQVIISNTGTMPLTGTVTIGAGATWLTANSNSFNVAAGTAGALVLTANAGSLAPGSYSTTVTLGTNDASNPSFTVNVRLFVAASLVQQPTRVLLEEVTGAWCGPCGAYGTPLVRQLNETYGDRLATIAYHVRSGGTGDPMATNQTEGMNSWLGASGYVPSAAFHRMRYDAERAGLMSEKRNLWEAALQAILQAVPTAPVAMEIVKYSYDAGTKRVTAQLKLTTADAISLANNATLRVSAIVKEDSIVYAQNGATESPYYHIHVARSFNPSATQGTQGMQVTLPPDATAEGGTVLLPGKEIIVDMSWVVTGVTVPTAGDVTFVTHLNYGSNPGPVMQAEDVVLTARIGGAAATLESTPDQLSKNVDAGATAAFNTQLRNLTQAPIEVRFERTSQSLPATWTSQLCVNNDCSDPATGSVTASIPANGTLSLVARINALTPSQTGSVTVRVTAPDTTFTYTYTATSGTLGINDEAAETAGLSLSAFPNPTSGATMLELNSARGGNATFEVFNAAGTRVMTLASERIDAGRSTKAIDLSTLPNGTYTVVFGVNGAKVSRTITLVR